MRKEFFIMLGICLTILCNYQITDTQAADNGNTKMVTVKKGDTLWTIAAAHTPSSKDIRDTVYSLKTLNNIREVDALQPGTKLYLSR